MRKFAGLSGRGNVPIYEKMRPKPDRSEERRVGKECRL